MVRIVSLLGLSVAAAGLWALYALSSNYRIFGGISTGQVLLWAAWIATALLLVLTIGRLAVAVSVALLDRDTTGLQRGIIYAVIAFVVVSGILAALGTNRHRGACHPVDDRRPGRRLDAATRPGAAYRRRDHDQSGADRGAVDVVALDRRAQA
jgi:hypothetical protein